MKFKCEICGRKLKAEKSIADSIGPECVARYAQGIAAAGSSVARIECLAGLNDAGISRWIVVAKRAIGAGRPGDARRFLEAAEREAASPLAMAA
ncbi:MAG: DUF6011 domain-containing protein [Blastocatellia bacterium]